MSHSYAGWASHYFAGCVQDIGIAFFLHILPITVIPWDPRLYQNFRVTCAFDGNPLQTNLLSSQVGKNGTVGAVYSQIA